MRTKEREDKQAVGLRDEWVEAIRRLEHDVADWARAEGWGVRSAEREIDEESTGRYAVPDLIIETPEGGRLHVEVKGRGPRGAAGRVQLSAWPTLFRVLLLHRAPEGDWLIRTDSGIPIRQPWNRETFVTVARDLLSAEG